MPNNGTDAPWIRSAHHAHHAGRSPEIGNGRTITGGKKPQRPREQMMKQHVTRNNVSRTRSIWTGMMLGVLVLSSMLVTTSCTTASYGDKFVQDGHVAEQYRFKIYVGGFQFAPPDSQAEKRIKEYMVENDYASYEIVNRRYNFIPSYYEFTVRFSKNVK